MLWLSQNLGTLRILIKLSSPKHINSGALQNSKDLIHCRDLSYLDPILAVHQEYKYIPSIPNYKDHSVNGYSYDLYGTTTACKKVY